MASARIYYDVHNPRMLPDSELARLSAREAAAACEQIDQSICATLTAIDQRFMSATRTVTDRLIPAVEAYGSTSKHTWDSVKLWKSFFEAAAGLQQQEPDDLLPPPPARDRDAEGQYSDQGDETAKHENYKNVGEASGSVSSDEGSRSEASTPNTTVRAASISPESLFAEPAEKPTKKAQRSGDVVSTKGVKTAAAKKGKGPAEPAWEDQESPFERLQQDMAKTRLVSESPYSAASFSMPQAPDIAPSSVAAAKHQKPQTRLRDLSMDSPDFDRPALATMSFQHPREKGNTAVHGQAQPASAASVAESPSSLFSREGSEAPSSVSRASDSSQVYSSFDVSSSSAAGPSFLDQEAQPPTKPRQPSLGGRRQSGGNSLLLQKVLIKSMARKDGRPNASTPARKSVKSLALPTDLPKQWNGIADLSTTPLSSFDTPQKPTPGKSQSRFKAGQSGSRTNRTTPGRQAASPFPSTSLSTAIQDDLSQGISFAVHGFRPPTFSVSKSRLSKTPAKEAARMITRDVLQRAALRNGGGIEDAGLDSPAFEPPSVVKNWATRGYLGNVAEPLRGASAQMAPAGSPVVRSRHADDLLLVSPEGQEDSFEAEFDPYSARQPIDPPPQPVFGHLADEGDELGSQYVQPGAIDTEKEWEDSFEAGEEGASMDQPGGGGDLFEETEVPLAGANDSYRDNSFDESRSFEETLFGAKAGPRPSQGGEAAGYGMMGEDGMQPMERGGDRQSDAFRLRGPGADDMVTLHGGRLLESQPFEASPLAGRDARYGL